MGASDTAAEDELAEELGVARITHVAADLTDEASDTALSLLLGLLRRTQVCSKPCTLHPGPYILHHAPCAPAPPP